MNSFYRVALGLAASTAVVQAWVMFDWIGDSSDHCDYPDECLSSWLPWAFTLSEYLWILTVVTGGIAVVVGGLMRRSRLEIASLGGAWGLAFITYCLTPMVQAHPGEHLTRAAVEGSALFWGGPGYTVAALLMAAASSVFGGQLLRSLRSGVDAEGVVSAAR